MTSSLPAIEKVLDRHGDPIWITGGANAQDGHKALHRCAACGGLQLRRATALSERLQLVLKRFQKSPERSQSAARAP